MHLRLFNRFISRRASDGRLILPAIILTALAGGLQSVPALNPERAVTQYSLQTWQTQDGLPQNAINAIVQTGDGYLWIGTDEGLVRFDGRRFSVFDKTNTPQLKGSRIAALCAGRDGSLWVGTKGGGLVKFSGGAFTLWTTGEGLPDNFVRAICDAGNGEIWVGTEGGLCRFSDGRWTTYATKDGLAANYVLALYEDRDGTLWVGTSDGGLARLANGRFTSITRRDGLFDDNISVILADDRLEDGQEQLWLGCDRGIFRVSKRELNDFADGAQTRVHCVAYTSEDGLTTSQLSSGSQPAGCRAADGRLWFATVRGAVVIDPRRITTNQLPPPVFIEQVMVDGKAVTQDGSIALPPGNGDLEIRYTGLSLVAPEKVRFKYQLAGFDREWIDAGTRREAFYTNLPPGNYRFRVMAMGCGMRRARRWS
ncbi:MAG: ligand-binding sensor domain-containing protein [Blastocatellia bacterium]